MCDSYGDGWNGNTLVIGDASFEAVSGDPCEELCYDGPVDVLVTCDGGSWQSEVSWTISDDSGVILEGGAPYSGCLGNCDTIVLGCTDDTADNYNPDANSDDGSCLYNGCAAGLTLGCSEQDEADGDCSSDSWIGDGYCDGYDEAYGINLCCYDNDGGDCTDDQCAPTPDWDASITGLTATSTLSEDGSNAVLYDWDDLSDGTSCEENGLITCEYDGSCADSEEDCPVDPWPNCDGNLSWLGDGYCDPSLNSEGCAFDLGDCCPGECASTVADGCPDNPDGCFGTEPGAACGECVDCIDESSPDNADDGACSDFEVGSDEECAASLVVAGSDGENDCYTDSYGYESGYFTFTWEGSCLATGITYFDLDTGEELTTDLSPYGFTGEFLFYGFGYEEYQEFIVSFNDAAGAGTATTACVEPDTGDDGGDEGCAAYTLTMNDAYGDGWNGNVLTNGDDSYTLETGSTGTACLDSVSDCITVDGGSWQSEVSWSIADSDGNEVLAGGAPYASEGCGGGGDDGGAPDLEAECDAAGGFYCGDDESNWTSFSPNGCVPANYICDGWDDCVDASDEGDCASADDGGGDGGSELEAACAAAGGHFCGDDTANWTTYSPDGCVPYWYICDGWDDCVDASDEAGCARSNDFSPRASISNNNLVNLKEHAHTHKMYKQSLKVEDKGLVSPVVINVATGEIEFNSTATANRAVSYTINLSCVDCNAGSPFEGTWTDVPESEFTIQGGDFGAEICATVSGQSTVLGSTSDSDSVCGDFGLPCELLDCMGQEYCGVESYIGDGYCDDGTWGYYFNCDEFNCDEGDCDCGPDCAAGDSNADGTLNVLDIVASVNYIVSGGENANDDFSYECADFDGDGVLNVLDIVASVNVIVGNTRASDATEVNLIKSDNALNINANGYVGGVQMTLSHGSDFSISLTDKAMTAAYNTSGNKTTLVIVAPESNELFIANGEYEIDEMIIANSAYEINASVVPGSFELSQAYPNPFNPSTTINLSIPEAGFVSVQVYNVMGQLVSTLSDGYMDAGYNTMTWDAGSFSSGLYLITATTANNSSTQKVMLLK